MRLPERNESTTRVHNPRVTSADVSRMRKLSEFDPADQGTPTAPDGCYFIGTSCTFFVQDCHYYCPGNAQCVTRGCGSCFGFWQGPPCQP